MQVLLAQPLEDVALDLHEVVGNEQRQQRVVVRVDGHVQGDRLGHDDQRVDQCTRSQGKKCDGLRCIELTRIRDASSVSGGVHRESRRTTDWSDRFLINDKVVMQSRRVQKCTGTLEKSKVKV